MTLRRVASLSVALALLGLAAPACMPLPPESQNTVERGITGDEWDVTLDPVLATPLTLVNRMLQPLPPESGEPLPASEDDAVKAFWAVIHDRPQWFPLRARHDDFVLVRSDTRGWMRVLRMAQVYDGVPVAGFGYEVRVLGNGRVSTLEGRFYPNLTIDIRPTYDALAAEGKARALFVGNAVDGPVPSVQFEYANNFTDARVLTVMTPVGNRPALAWGIVVAANSRDFARVYIDANNGSILAREYVGWSGPH